MGNIPLGPRTPATGSPTSKRPRDCWGGVRSTHCAGGSRRLSPGFASTTKPTPIHQGSGRDKGANLTNAGNVDQAPDAIAAEPLTGTEMSKVPVSSDSVSQDPEVSIIVPVYRNAETLHDLYIRLRAVCETRRLSYEILFVDDFCPSGSLAVLRTLAQRDPQVGVLALERNVGQHRAIRAALPHAQGKWVVVMDADLQDPPEAIPDLLSKLEEGFAAVFAGRRGRYESPFRLLTSRLFKRLLHLSCGVPPDAGLFLAMSRQMVETLLVFDDSPPSLLPLIGYTGLPLASIPVARDRRPRGDSAYNLWGRLKTGLLAVGWAIFGKRHAGQQISGPARRNDPVKTYIGARFVFPRQESHRGDSGS